MKRLAVRSPVLNIWSTGTRVPSISRDTQFWSRIRRKAASVARGLRRVHARLYVYGPLSVPAYEYSLDRSCNRALLTAQQRMGEFTWDRQVDRIWSALEDRGLAFGRTLN